MPDSVKEVTKTLHFTIFCYGHISNQNLVCVFRQTSFSIHSKGIFGT